MSDETGAAAVLSQREFQVCMALCRGLTNKETAIEIGIGVRTVESHRENVLKKYRVRNTVQLVRAVYGITEEA